MSRVTINLQEPIQWGSETISQLDMRKPKAKDMRDMPLQMSMNDMLNLAGKLTGHPPSVIDELSMDDMAAVLEQVGNFMGRGRPTGNQG